MGLNNEVISIVLGFLNFFTDRLEGYLIDYLDLSYLYKILTYLSQIANLIGTHPI
jgi:hypothetical protein